MRSSLLSVYCHDFACLLIKISLRAMVPYIIRSLFPPYIYLNTVFPLMDVNILEVPYLNLTASSSLEVGNSSSPLTLTLQEGESIQWTCAVTAGMGDELLWLFNGEHVPSSNQITFNEVSR